MSYTTRILFLSVISIYALLGPAVAQTDRHSIIPSTPEGDLVAEFFDVISVPEPGRWRSFIESRYAKGFRDVAPMDTHLDILGRTYEHNRKFRIESYHETSEGEAEVLAESELTGEWTRFVFRVEGEAPRRLSGVLIRSGSPPADEAPKPVSWSGFSDRLDVFLDRLAAADAFSGTVVVARTGRLVFSRSYGDADKAQGAENHLDTRFSLGSMNKMFTAVAIAQLVERNEIDFSHPVSAYLPELPNRSAADQIQIRHLLSHTSGMGDYLGEAARKRADAFATLDDYIELVRGDTLQFTPGDRWSYSNAGFLVLGKIIEEVADTSYYAYVRDNIYEPAGMARAGSRKQSSVIPDLAIGYEKDYAEGGVEYRNNRFSIGLRGSPAGGGYASALDLMQFANALGDGTLVSPSLADTLTTAKPHLGASGYGYGFSVRSERQIYGHSGGFDGVGANLDVFSREDVTAVVLSNYGGASGAVVRKIRGLVQRIQ